MKLAIFDNQPLSYGTSTQRDGEAKKHQDRWKFSQSLLNKVSDRSFFYPEQIHGNEVKIISSREPLPNRSLIEACDGLVTNRPDITLMVLHADCHPVFLFDPKQRVIGLVHSGWRGTAYHIGLRALTQMILQFGSQIENILVGIGPGARQECYGFEKVDYQRELPEWQPFLQQFESKWHIDLVGYMKQMFLDAGILPQHLFDSRICTICNSDYHSWTRQKQEQTTCACGISYLQLAN